MSNGSEEKKSTLFKAGVLTAAFGAAAMAVAAVCLDSLNNFDKTHADGAAAKRKIAAYQSLGYTEQLTLKLYNLERENRLLQTGASAGASAALLLTGLGCIVADGRRRKTPAAPAA